MTTPIFDTHTHLDLIARKASQNVPNDKTENKLLITEADIWQNARQNQVQYALQIGIDLSSSQKALSLAHELPGIFAAIGYHPSLQKNKEEQIPAIMDLARRERASGNKFFIAIGEVGLDYYWIKDAAHRQRQRKIFLQFVELARELDKTVVIHCRNSEGNDKENDKENAMQDCLNILQNIDPLPRAIMHCYGGSPDEISHFEQLGCYISFAGNVTFPKAVALQEAAKKTSLNRILAETDAPYLTPVPFRGQLNAPGYVVHTIEYLAQLRGVTIQEMQQQIWDNSLQAFSLTNAEIANF